MIWIIPCALHIITRSTHSLTQIGDLRLIRQTALFTIFIETPNGGISFGGIVFIYSSNDICRVTAHWSCSGAITLLKTICVLLCHSLCQMYILLSLSMQFTVKWIMTYSLCSQHRSNIRNKSWYSVNFSVSVPTYTELNYLKCWAWWRLKPARCCTWLYIGWFNSFSVLEAKGL